MGTSLSNLGFYLAFTEAWLLHEPFKALTTAQGEERNTKHTDVFVNGQPHEGITQMNVGKAP